MLFLVQAGLGPAAAGTAGRNAAEGSVALSVGARARAWARIDAEASPDRLVLTPEDVARGFVDVPGAARLSVRTNSSVGYTLRVRLRSESVAIAELPGLPGRPVFAAEGGDWVRDLQGPGAEDLVLEWRFHLDPATAPGAHPWPVTVAVLPR